MVEPFPKPLLSETITEDIKQRNKQDVENRLRGNCLYATLFHETLIYWFAAGEAMNLLECLYSSMVDPSIPSQGVSVLELKTPIRQITGCRQHSKEWIAIRTWSGVTILECCLETMENRLIQSLHFTHIPVDIQFSEFISGQLVILLQNGKIELWDANVKPIGTLPNFNVDWASLSFGSFPQQLYIAQHDSVQVMDIRLQRTSPLIVLEDRKGIQPRYDAFAKDPNHSFQFALCSQFSTLLYDARNPKKPMIEFGLEETRDSSFSRLGFCQDGMHRKSYSTLTSLFTFSC